MLAHNKLENQLLFLDAATSQTTQRMLDIAVAGGVFPFLFEGGNDTQHPLSYSICN
jgi:hypothetical protein